MKLADVVMKLLEDGGYESRYGQAANPDMSCSLRFLETYGHAPWNSRLIQGECRRK